MIIIDKNTSILKLVSDYPKIKKVMVEIGFKDIVKPGMLTTAGRFMTLKKGSDIKKIDWEFIVSVFKRNGFDLI